MSIAVSERSRALVYVSHKVVPLVDQTVENGVVVFEALDAFKSLGIETHRPIGKTNRLSRYFARHSHLLFSGHQEQVVWPFAWSINGTVPRTLLWTCRPMKWSSPRRLSRSNNFSTEKKSS